MTSFIGFFQVYSLSNRFRQKAKYLRSCLITDTILQLKGSNEKLEEFISKSHHADTRFQRSYYWCSVSVLAQAIFLLLSFLFFGMFIWVNFVAKSTP